MGIYQVISDFRKAKNIKVDELIAGSMSRVSYRYFVRESN